ncbi:F0F1 ATP synthase subunit A [Nordella sp. HKS 07]|uniref:F0F1 ATP synthase subunit A n=1 Tax=Nordella sp. HKS 07 TaxID=2712222 RepID=UPI0013E10955|nr:F0F1 ATP synthase subunit A [Nordella sp. HKS 07]QIG52511.1 F0F1 ATP synthase subunit A [Nordella sp. HKS 07]
MIDPIHQFHINNIIDLGPFSLTNSGLWAIIAVVCAALLFLLAPKHLIPTRLQSVSESMYEFIENMTKEVLHENARTYFPFVLTLFTFILFCNVLGLIPYSFTVTSHIIVTLALALVVFIGATIIGFYRNGFGYLKLFVPSGVPAILLPLVVVIEIVSYFIRPMSLSIRLFANMMAGHMMLKVMAGFVVMLGVTAGWLPLIAMVGLYGLELLVAALQAYVFALLTCMYLSDAMHVDH